MKIKQFVHITDVDDFIYGKYMSCFTLFGHESSVKTWICLPESIEIEVNLDFNDLRNKAIKATDAEIAAVTKEATEKLAKLHERKQELQALTYNPLDYDGG